MCQLLRQQSEAVWAASYFVPGKVGRRRKTALKARAIAPLKYGEGGSACANHARDVGRRFQTWTSTNDSALGASMGGFLHFGARQIPSAIDVETR
jgi:hypothetical protein